MLRMNKKEYVEFHKKFCQDMIDITQRKNADYCGEGDNPFHNLELVQRMGLTNTETGIITRMTDKMARLISFNQSGKFEVEDEKLLDTCIDLANYASLLAAYVQNKMV